MLKKIVKNITPPLLWNILRKKCSSKDFGIHWRGDYASFEEASRTSSGYAEKNIELKVVLAARAVRNGNALWERDSVCFYHEEYNMHLLAALFKVAALNHGRLHVLDFGGALGCTYMQHRLQLNHLPEITWHVVEQEHFVKLGKEEFSSDKLLFYDTIESVFEEFPINCVVLSGVLQYLPNPFELLKKIHGYNPFSIYIGRTPIHDGKDKITIQYVPEEIYEASYPNWFFNKDKLLTNFMSDYNALPWTQCPIEPTGFMDTFLLRKNI